MAEWHRGEITTRRFLVLVAGLPEDNALVRAERKDEGEPPPISLGELLQWRILGALEHLAYYKRGELRLKPHADRFKWAASPFAKPETEQRYGHVAEDDRDAAALYLSSLYNQPGPDMSAPE